MLGRAASWRLRQHRRAKWVRLLIVIGVAVFLASVTPLPWWLLVLSAILPLLWLNVPFRADDGVRRSRILRRIQPLVEIVPLITMVTELLERQRLQAQQFPQWPAVVHVIGYSLSAGNSNEQNQLWPKLVESAWNIPVHNHAQVGATSASALRQADEVTGDDCVVLIEIGGNDFFEGRTSRQIEADLEHLLSRLSRPRRTLVLFELPLPPQPGAYDLARVQRRLAHRHAERLISRRDFALELLSPGATSDGLYLSKRGHRALADLVLRRLTPAGN